jgi:hypothetical protein
MTWDGLTVNVKPFSVTTVVKPEPSDVIDGNMPATIPASSDPPELSSTAETAAAILAGGSELPERSDPEPTESLTPVSPELGVIVNVPMTIELGPTTMVTPESTTVVGEGGGTL